MDELQRSVTSFRRQGSSGLVWDDKFLAGLRDQEAAANKPNDNNNQNQQQEQENEMRQREQQQRHVSDSVVIGSVATLERSRSAQPYRTVNVEPPPKDPPSPKVPTCGLCGFFAKPVAAASAAAATHKSNPKSKKRIR